MSCHRLGFNIYAAMQVRSKPARFCPSWQLKYHTVILILYLYAVGARTPLGSGGSHRLVLTAGKLAATTTEALSFDAILGSLSSSANTGGIGGVTIWAAGSFTADVVNSARTRVGGTSCEATWWGSATALGCLTARGGLASHAVVVTAGIQLGSSFTAAFSFDHPSLSPFPQQRENSSNIPHRDSISITISARHSAPVLTIISASALSKNLRVSPCVITEDA
jgi:hypothetical protein